MEGLILEGRKGEGMIKYREEGNRLFMFCIKTNAYKTPKG